MVLTWIGIVVMVVVLVGWVVYENRRLVRYATARVRVRRHARVRSRMRRRRRSCYERKANRVPAEADARQVVRVRDVGDLIVCVIVVLVIVLGTDIGDEFRPDRLSWTRWTGHPPAAPPRAQPASAGRSPRRLRGAQGRLPDQARRRRCRRPAGVRLLRRQGLSEQPDQAHAGPGDRARPRADRLPVRGHPDPPAAPGARPPPVLGRLAIDPLRYPEDPSGFRQLAVVRIDATTGEVASVENQGPSEPGPMPGRQPPEEELTGAGRRNARPRPPAHRLRAPRGVLGGDARARRRAGGGRGRRGRAAARLARVRRRAGDGRADGRRRRRRPSLARA